MDKTFLNNLGLILSLIVSAAILLFSLNSINIKAKNNIDKIVEKANIMIVTIHDEKGYFDNRKIVLREGYKITNLPKISDKSFSHFENSIGEIIENGYKYNKLSGSDFYIIYTNE